MKSSSANLVKTLAGIDSYATSQDQFVAERYNRYYSDTVMPHSAITGVADVVLCYYTICSGRHIFQKRPSYKFIKSWRNVYLNLKGQGSLNLNKNTK
jgi:hypothetical protein